jgi:hypothetical protein
MNFAQGHGTQGRGTRKDGRGHSGGLAGTFIPMAEEGPGRGRGATLREMPFGSARLYPVVLPIAVLSYWHRPPLLGSPR